MQRYSTVLLKVPVLTVLSTPVAKKISRQWLLAGGRRREFYTAVELQRVDMATLTALHSNLWWHCAAGGSNVLVQQEFNTVELQFQLRAISS